MLRFRDGGEAAVAEVTSGFASSDIAESEEEEERRLGGILKAVECNDKGRLSKICKVGLAIWKAVILPQLGWRKSKAEVDKV